jgi:hypothetical protein
MDETNLLSLIRPWLDNICQITMKRATVPFCKKILDLNRPLEPFSSERNRVRKHNAEQREYRVLHLMPVVFKYKG